MRWALGQLALGLIATIGLAVSLHAWMAPLPEATPPSARRSDSASPPSASTAAVNPPAEASAAARTALADRPLFDPSRRPYAPPPPAPPPRPSAAPTPAPPPAPRLPKLTEQGWVLSGTVVGADDNAEDRIALLRSARGGAVRKVKQGEELQGWRVVRVEPGRLSLRAGAQNDEMVLPRADTTSTAAPSRAATAAPTYVPTPPPRPMPVPQR